MFMNAIEKTIFDHYSNFYDLLYADKDYEAETAYILGLVKKYMPEASSILELGSGTGNYSSQFCRKGYQVHGIEQSTQMLAQSLEKNIQGFTAAEGDISHFELHERFDIAVSLFHVVSYLTRTDDLLSCFRNVAAHLKPGGCFIFDVWYSPAVYTLVPGPRVKSYEDEQVKIMRYAQPEMLCEENTVNVSFKIDIYDKAAQSSRQLMEVHAMRHFSTPEIDLLARLSGLKRVHSEEFLTRKDPGTDTWGVCYILKKDAATDTR
jgi:SAM-dependent methyltransferase